MVLIFFLSDFFFTEKRAKFLFLTWTKKEAEKEIIAKKIRKKN